MLISFQHFFCCLSLWWIIQIWSKWYTAVMKLMKNVFPHVLLLVLPMLMKDGKDKSDRRGKHKATSGFLLVPGVMLSECQNSGKWLLLTVVSFKDGGARLAWLCQWIGVRQNGRKSAKLYRTDPVLFLSDCHPFFVCFSCHLKVHSLIFCLRCTG